MPNLELHRRADFWFRVLNAVAMFVIGIALLFLAGIEYHHAPTDDMWATVGFGIACLVVSGINAWAAWRRR